MNQNHKSIFAFWIPILRGVLIILFFITFLSFWLLERQNTYIKSNLSEISDLKTLTQIITTDTTEAVINADRRAFQDLRRDLNEFEHHLTVLLRGKQNEVGDIIVPPNLSVIKSEQMKTVQQIWETVKKEGEFILTNEAPLLALYETSIKSLAPTIDELQVNYLKLIQFLKQKDTHAFEILGLIAEQSFELVQIEDNIKIILQVEKNTKDLEERLPKQIKYFVKEFDEIRAKNTDPSLIPLLVEMQQQIETVAGDANHIAQVGGLLYKLYESRQKISDLRNDFLAAVKELEKAYITAFQEQFFSKTLSFLLSGITLLVLLLLVYFSYRENLLDLKIAEEEKQKLEMEIKQLVDELENLASGDLAVVATKKSTITTDIAEAINYAINALRKLVVTINNTAKRLGISTREVKKIANDLAKASERQSTEILEATGSINAMAESIDLVSEHAKSSALVAENSVNIAKEGALVVKNTKEGMARIHEQIQDTEKRIRRLGESSHEIGEITSLIDEISEQTNILALNAAIQAAMAGDAGKGFAVVADEVQRLAEKSGGATKEVENLVKTIQNDTSRAVESMEKAMTEVVNGTALANDAGAALEKIEQVSQNLSALIQDISKAAMEQSIVATKISKMMVVIEDITKLTTTSSLNTSDAISNLAHLVDELHISVEEFKLPTDQYE